MLACETGSGRKEIISLFCYSNWCTGMFMQGHIGNLQQSQNLNLHLLHVITALAQQVLPSPQTFAVWLLAKGLNPRKSAWKTSFTQLHGENNSISSQQTKISTRPTDQDRAVVPLAIAVRHHLALFIRLLITYSRWQLSETSLEAIHGTKWQSLFSCCGGVNSGRRCKSRPAVPAGRAGHILAYCSASPDGSLLAADTSVFVTEP